MDRIQEQVQSAIRLYEQKNIVGLREQLYELYINFNKRGGGKLIINYPDKDQLAECFTLMLRFDWVHDNNVREVWAENGFYCLIEYINSIHNQKDQQIGGFDLFLHLYYSRKHLIPKISSILSAAALKQELVFDANDYEKGAEYIINQFVFLSAQIIKPLVLKNENILAVDIRNYFYHILDDRSYYQLSPTEIFMKAKFISRIIGYILKEM